VFLDLLIEDGTGWRGARIDSSPAGTSRPGTHEPASTIITTNGEKATMQGKRYHGIG
jgi:hypothetical protein